MFNNLKVFKSKEDRNKTILVLLIVLIFFIILGFLFKIYFSQIDELRILILSFGILAPIIFILFQILQCLIPPIPGQLFVILGGYLFGPIYGLILSIIGSMIGSYLAFILARKIGTKFVDKIITKDAQDKLHNITNNNAYLFFLIYLLPFFPDDFLPYIAGLGQMDIRKFLVVTFYGRLASFFILSFSLYFFLGSWALALISLSLLVVIIVLVYLFRHKFKK